jgi:hypothetical protein
VQAERLATSDAHRKELTMMRGAFALEHNDLETIEGLPARQGLFGITTRPVRAGWPSTRATASHDSARVATQTASR